MVNTVRSGQLVVNKTGGNMLQRLQPPLYLAETPWLDYERDCALASCESLTKELRALSGKATTKRVHDARVALRRWSAVWAVLKEDGWESKKFKHGVGAKLKKLRSLLGELRDWDVNLELGKSMCVPQSTLKVWARKRASLRRSSKSLVKDLDTTDMAAELASYLLTRPDKMRTKMPGLLQPMSNAYEHLDRYLALHEDAVRQLEPRANSIEELHQLRLEIKRWRYTLTEFFGLTNLHLVRAQQYLGKLHDIDRLKKLLEAQELKRSKPAQKCANQLEDEITRLRREFNAIRRDLPYGLRPTVSSM
jgi:CHAD domain-containing protein